MHFLPRVRCPGCIECTTQRAVCAAMPVLTHPQSSRPPEDVLDHDDGLLHHVVDLGLDQLQQHIDAAAAGVTGADESWLVIVPLMQPAVPCQDQRVNAACTRQSRCRRVGGAAWGPAVSRAKGVAQSVKPRLTAPLILARKCPMNKTHKSLGSPLRRLLHGHRAAPNGPHS